MFHFLMIFLALGGKKIVFFYHIVTNKGNLEMKTQTKRGQYTLNSQQIQKIINSAGTFRDRLLLKILAYTGIRRDEAAGIEIKNFNPETREILIRGKGEKIRSVFLTEELNAELKIYLGKNQTRRFLFESKQRPNYPISSKQVNIICQRAGEAAGITNPNPAIKHINPHLFRHSLARRLKAAGTRIETISALLGHSSITQTLETYGLPSQAEIKEEVLKALA